MPQRRANASPARLNVIESVVDTVVKDTQLSKEKRDALLPYFGREGHSVFGLVNGITRLAQDFENADDQVALERYAGRILAEPMLVVGR